MKEEGITPDRQRFEFSLDVRHKGQINEVEVVLPATRLPSQYEGELRKRFVGRYEKLYGRGSALPGAILEIVVCRLRAKALTPQPKLVVSKQMTRSIPGAALRRKRDIYWPDLKKRRATPVYDGELFLTGNSVSGPAIVETSDTTVVVPPGAQLKLDRLGNFELTF
jgi:N-methylhydantoinase A